MKIRFIPYGASKSCKELAAAVREEGHQVLRIKKRGSAYRGYNSHLIINWGRHDRGSLGSHINVLNNFDAVSIAANKLRCFEVLNGTLGDHIPQYTTDKERAIGWIRHDHDTVFCRTLLGASCGKGIVLAKEEEELVNAPLYTRKVPYGRELRVHVFKGRVIDYVQKRKMSSERREEEGIEEVDRNIRSHGNGWVFAREGVSLSDSEKEIAVRGIEAVGLDFGAIDMITTPEGVPVIIEINTAPGLEGTTLTSYKEAVLSLTS